MKQKTAKETVAISTHLVLPNDTNIHNTLFGGKLMSWIDVIASISARRHCGREVVTASVNSLSFNKPIKLGDVVTLDSKVSRAFNSSMEIYVDVFVEDYKTGKHIKANEAIYTFVAIDQNGSTIEVPELIPETEEEIKRFGGALRRKQLSLILAGKMETADAKELKALFFGKENS
jgi:acyl-CoA hydrolase